MKITAERLEEVAPLVKRFGLTSGQLARDHERTTGESITAEAYRKRLIAWRDQGKSCEDCNY